MINNDSIILVCPKFKGDIHALNSLITFKFYVGSLATSREKSYGDNIRLWTIEHCIVLVKSVPLFVIRRTSQVIDDICVIQVKVLYATAKILCND